MNRVHSGHTNNKQVSELTVSKVMLAHLDAISAEILCHQTRRSRFSILRQPMPQLSTLFAKSENNSDELIIEKKRNAVAATEDA